MFSISNKKIVMKKIMINLKEGNKKLIIKRKVRVKSSPATVRLLSLRNVVCYCRACSHIYKLLYMLGNEVVTCLPASSFIYINVYTWSQYLKRRERKYGKSRATDELTIIHKWFSA